MATPPQPPPESPGTTSRSLTTFVLLGFYASMMVWHVWRSGSLEPLRSLGILLLALYFGLCWVAVERIGPRISKKIVIHRRWVAHLVIAGFWMSLIMVQVVSTLTEDLGLAERIFGLDAGSQGAAAAPARFGMPLRLGLLILVYSIIGTVWDVFKLPPDPEPPPPPPKPPRPPGMQDRVITHRWWEKYY